MIRPCIEKGRLGRPEWPTRQGKRWCQKWSGADFLARGAGTNQPGATLRGRDGHSQTDHPSPECLFLSLESVA
jgi:hypothetical protein